MRVSVWAVVWSGAVVLGTAVGSAQSPSLTWLGVLANGERSHALGVSAEGATVVGEDIAITDADGNGGELRAFRWTRTGGMQPLPAAGAFSQATGVSADGAIVVGWTETPGGEFRAARWSPDGSLTLLDTPAGSESRALGVSANGTMIVGWAEDASNRLIAARWLPDGSLETLGVPAGYMTSWATAVCSDGAVIAATAYQERFRWRAFRWDATGWATLDLLAGYENSIANALSANGAVIVGAAFNEGGVTERYAVRWLADGSVEPLATLGGRMSEASAVSADGAFIVGYAEDASGRTHAVRWVQGVGVQNLNSVYASLLTDGSILIGASAVSPDGRYIVGWGYNAATGHAEGFLLDTVPEPASLLALSAGLTGLLRRRRAR